LSQIGIFPLAANVVILRIFSESPTFRSAPIEVNINFTVILDKEIDFIHADSIAKTQIDFLRIVLGNEVGGRDMNISQIPDGREKEDDD